MKNILVSIDFDGTEFKLMEMSRKLAASFNSKIWLLHVSAPDPDFVGYDVGPQYIRDFRALELRKEHKAIQDYANALKTEGIEADGMLIKGATIEMILEEAEKLNIDMIIVGYEEHNFVYEALVGSISKKLIKKSNIPILVVPVN